ncbi:MAG: ATP-dependent DNA ligase [Rhizobiaceae bacterium]
MVKFPLPLSTRPMEAKTASAIPKEDGPWQYEPKWDGFRCLVFKEADQVELRAKSGKPLGRYFPEVVEFFRRFRADRFVLDGELMVERGGANPFGALQMRLHPAESRIRKLAAETPAGVIVFDMLSGKDGATMLRRPLSARRPALESFAAEHGGLKLSPTTRDVKVAKTWLAKPEGNMDGVIAKRLCDPYLPGERAMIKVKRLRTADCVVGGFRYLAARREVGSLLLGLYDSAGKLDHVGFTATIAEGERPQLTARLEAMREPPGFTGKAPGGPSRWSARGGEWEAVRPELVVEVRFDHVTGQRFRHGTKLVRWRPDKAPEQCTLEQIA